MPDTSCQETTDSQPLLISLILFFLSFPLIVSANEIVDVMASDSPCYDTDGDGYGWNGSTNCAPFLGTVDGQVARLISNVGDLEDFGSSVVIEGDRMLVSGGGTNVFLLKRDAGNQWSLETGLSVNDPENNSTYASFYNLTLQGDTIVFANRSANSTVSIPGTPYTALRQTGAVYVFKESNGSWAQQAKLTASDPQEYARFGDFIALNGNLLLVSSSYKERDDAWQGVGASPVPWVEGAVYVFHRNFQGEWIEEAILERDDNYGNFGRAVSLDANGVAIIGSGYDISPYVFRRVAPGDWRQVSRLETIEAAVGPVRSFAHNTETLLIGSGEGFEGTQVHDYINNGNGTFSPTGQILSTGNYEFNLRDNTAVIERNYADYNIDNDIDVFKRSAAGDWSLHSTLKPSLDDRTSFGHVFSVSGNTVVAGAAARYDSLFKRGSVYVFDISQPNDGQRRDTSCVDPDGDGWGWNQATNSSCTVSTNSNASSAICIDSDGDGWGWDGTGSCRVIAPSGSTNTYRCDYTNADLYNGWGWNPIAGESCAPQDPSTPQGCDYSQSALHSGWGWNAATQEPCEPVVAPPSTSNCDYTDASLYNGWGWNAESQQSCPPL